MDAAQSAPELPVIDDDNNHRRRLSREERSRIATEAANRRWANAREQRAQAVAKAAAKASRPPAKAALVKKRPAVPREFSSALKAAEMRLAKALQERAFHAYQYNAINAEIPNLVDIVKSLRNPFGAQPGLTAAIAVPTLEQIMGEAPLQYQNPPLSRPQPIPAIPVPQQLHPANTVTGRGGGGAIGMELQAEEDEDKYLNESGIAGGQWH